MAVFKMHQLAMLPSFFLSLLLFISFAPVSSGSVGYEYDLGVTPVNALFPRQTTASSSTGTESYTCGPGSPCSNGACCGSSGWCGYGPTYCGDGCQSDCDATAECGEYAATAGTTCPLNVCCSQYGFCGTTSDFCDTGCQSGCTFSEPGAAASNVQTKIIGYWESWNTDHACGTMPAGSIPASMLTHLNVAFGYIDPSSYKITAMDGVDSSIYQNIGNVKAQNTNLKISIALGGWSFTDPGTYRSVFTTMVSSSSLRATFIENLLGFLDEYGYDGVDFDWEYPGADDRGGNTDDGVNYTALLKELQSAISAAGKEYIVTFTAPTSYWYLRHFDLANMVQYVDWVNLMAYDLHGVWDSSDPIGNQVLAHTNLTEIDQALDLFWRVDVDPSKIVLGLGFYGRSFTLSDASCWQPGCAFSGAGAAGPCTATEGILSYYEIDNILTSTGATAYLDETAAVRYMVYDGNSWISYDDATTFKLKIDYANNKGLGGLMVWAIDLDDASLDALSAISDSAYINSSSSSAPVDLTKIFPSEYIPSSGDSKYGLVNIGSAASSGETDPSKTGIGFFLITSDSFATTTLKKRAGEPEPFTFIDCPQHVLDQPVDKKQTASVVCLNQNVEDCFRVMERGVEGTMVEMPDNCAPNSIARAISLTLSPDQYVPEEIRKRNPTSEVYDFTFDFDFDLMRRDTNLTSLRIDYSNYGGYWDQTVDSDGIQDSSSSKSRKRYFAPTIYDWKDMYSGGRYFNDVNYTSLPQTVDVDMSQEIFWETTDSCDWEGTDYGDGVAAWVQGSVDAQFYYGYTIIGERTLSGSINWVQTNAFMTAYGATDLSFGIGGMGNIDISLAGKGNPAIQEGSKVHLGGNVITATGTGLSVGFQPYYKLDYEFATLNGTTDQETNSNFADVDFNGLMTARVISDLGQFIAYYPAADTIGSDDDARDKNQISIGSGDILYSTNGGGTAYIASHLTLGVDASFGGCSTNGFCTIGTLLPGITLKYATGTKFIFQPDGDTSSCADYEVSTYISSGYTDYTYVDWPRNTSTISLAGDTQEPASGQVCYTNYDASAKRSELPSVTDDDDFNTTYLDLEERAGAKGNPWGIAAGAAMSVGSILSGKVDTTLQNNVEDLVNAAADAFACRKCFSCLKGDQSLEGVCCGCTSMDYVYGLTDLPTCDSCDDVNYDGGGWPGSDSTASSTKRGIEEYEDLDNDLWWLQDEDDSQVDDEDETHPLGKRVAGIATKSYKNVNVCGDTVRIAGNGKYPAFPASASWPWDGIENNRYDDISAYWGNTSADCADWSVGQLNAADTRNTPSGTFRAPYDTEHVFEGQLIGDFFNQWLANGKVRNQSPAPDDPQQIATCTWTNQYIKTTYGNAWTDWNGNNVPFIKLLLQELGNLENQERLTIMLKRPNQMKGRMFSGIQPSAYAVYAGMSLDAQLQVTKEMGMVFEYLNSPVVWSKFCATYDNIYLLMVEFDLFYLNLGSPTSIVLSEEWKAYINEVLSSLVNRSQASFWTMYSLVSGTTGNSQTDNFYIDKWLTNLETNLDLITITGTCTHL